MNMELPSNDVSAAKKAIGHFSIACCVELAHDIIRTHDRYSTIVPTDELEAMRAEMGRQAKQLAEQRAVIDSLHVIIHGPSAARRGAP